MIDEPRTSAYRAALVGSVPALGLLAALFQAPQLAALAIAWLAVLLHARFAAGRRVARLDVARRASHGAHEDEDVNVTLELANDSSRSVELVEVTDYFGAALASGQRVVEQGPLPARSAVELSYAVQCSRTWGVYQLGPIVVGAAEPLGLFNAEKTVPDMAELALFPRVFSVRELVAQGARATFQPTPASVGRPGTGELPLGVRDYRPGDDPRRVHWRASARLGHLVVKELETDLLPYLTVFLDLDASNRSGLGRQSGLERLVRIAASCLATAGRDGWYLQLVGEGAEPLVVPPGRGTAHLALALDALIRVRQGGSTSLPEVISRNLGSVPDGSTALILSGTQAPDPGLLRTALEGLGSRGARCLAVLVDHRTFRAFRQESEDPEAISSRRRQTLEVLDDLGVRHALLSADDDVEARLDAGLFGSAQQGAAVAARRASP